MTQAEQAIRRYFDAWLAKSDAGISALFVQDAVYSECYGPEYRGREQILRWFHEWNETGSVTKWEIKTCFQSGALLAAEWSFCCVDRGRTSAFDGVTIAQFDADGRIRALREYRSEPEHVLPYGP